MGIFEVGVIAICIIIRLQAYGIQGLECGGLNKMALIGCGTTRKSALVGGSMSLVSEAPARPSDALSLPAVEDPDVELSVISSIMSACTLLCSMITMD